MPQRKPASRNSIHETSCATAKTQARQKQPQSNASVYALACILQRLTEGACALCTSRLIAETSKRGTHADRHCTANHTATVGIAPLVLLSVTLYHENQTPADMLTSLLLRQHLHLLYAKPAGHAQNILCMIGGCAALRLPSAAVTTRHAAVTYKRTKPTANMHVH
jgi:MarR-like DNA-binding transcriptional regulator SgrR of sgrS sRNA